MKKDLLVISLYPNSDMSKSVLKECISRLNTVFDIALSTHYPVDSDIQKLVNYYVYDTFNDLIENGDNPIVWLQNDMFYLQVKHIRNYAYAAYSTMVNSVNLLQNKYEHFYFLNGDSLIDSQDIEKLLNLKQVALEEGKKATFFKKFSGMVDTQIFFSDTKFFLENIATVKTKDEFVTYTRSFSHPYVPYVLESFFSERIDGWCNNKVRHITSSPKEYFSNSKIDVLTNFNGRPEKTRDYLIYLVKEETSNKIYFVYVNNNSSFEQKDIKVKINNEEFTMTNGNYTMYKEVLMSGEQIYLEVEGVSNTYDVQNILSNKDSYIRFNTPVEVPSKVYYSCLFYKELDLLELQLEQNFDYVDKFIIVESNKTHAGNPKELIFQQNTERFEKYAEKIIHLVCDFDSELFSTYEKNISQTMQWKREMFQRDYPILCGEIQFNPSDIIITSDADEIINMESVSSFLNSNLVDGAYKLEMYLMHYHMDTNLYRQDSGSEKVWYHPFLVKYSDLPKYNNSLSHIRTNVHSEDKVIRDGGWHFSYLMDVNSIMEKLNNFAHSEDEFVKYMTPQKITTAIKNFELFYSNSETLKLKQFPRNLLPTAVKNNLTKWSKHFVNHKKSLVIIGCYLDSEVKKEVLRNNLKLLKDRFDVLVVSHYPIDAEFQRLATHTIYDSNNDVGGETGCYTWVANDSAYLQYHPKSCIDPSYAVYQLIRNPLPYAKILGYDSFFFIEGDLLIAEDDLERISNLKTTVVSETTSAGFFKITRIDDSTPIYWWDCQLFYSDIDFFLDRTPTLLSRQEFNTYCQQNKIPPYLESVFYTLLCAENPHMVTKFEMNVCDYMTNSQLNISNAITQDNGTNLLEAGYHDELTGKFIKFTIHIVKLIDTPRIFLVYKGYDNLYPTDVHITVNGELKLTVINGINFMYQEISSDTDMFDIRIFNGTTCIKERILTRSDISNSPDFIKLH